MQVFGRRSFDTRIDCFFYHRQQVPLLVVSRLIYLDRGEYNPFRRAWGLSMRRIRLRVAAWLHKIPAARGSISSRAVDARFCIIPSGSAVKLLMAHQMRTLYGSSLQNQILISRGAGRLQMCRPYRNSYQSRHSRFAAVAPIPRRVLQTRGFPTICIRQPSPPSYEPTCYQYRPWLRTKNGEQTVPELVRTGSLQLPLELYCPLKLRILPTWGK